ncbi:MAG: hypothetical protein U9Q79_06480, partial [Candidatus Hydrogenedentes bacterium]|nr:hypothetical protein [Candidatus Hydrogenedentota bacterium]
PAPPGIVTRRVDVSVRGDLPELNRQAPAGVRNGEAVRLRTLKGVLGMDSASGVVGYGPRRLKTSRHA